MSEIGVSSGLYDEIRDYVELIDRVLVGLRAGTSSSEDGSRVRLARFLEQLANSQTGDLSTRLVRLLLRGEPQLDRKRLAKIGKMLLVAQVDDAVIGALEKMAALLEQERIETAARMRGPRR